MNKDKQWWYFTFPKDHILEKYYVKIYGIKLMVISRLGSDLAALWVIRSYTQNEWVDDKGQSVADKKGLIKLKLNNYEA